MNIYDNSGRKVGSTSDGESSIFDLGFRVGIGRLAIGILTFVGPPYLIWLATHRFVPVFIVAAPIALFWLLFDEFRWPSLWAKYIKVCKAIGYVGAVVILGVIAVLGIRFANYLDRLW